VRPVRRGLVRKNAHELPFSAVVARHPAGFTILELVFVMALVAIMAGMTVPLAQSAVAMYRLDASSVTLASTLVEARSEALKRNRPVWVRLDIAAGTAQIQTTAAGGGTTNVGGVRPLAPATGFAGIADPIVDVSFDAMGRVDPQIIRVQSQRMMATHTLRVGATGRVNIESP
jgi:prepilin-type N-terminal cleavage/methylation domain-containing protein